MDNELRQRAREALDISSHEVDILGSDVSAIYRGGPRKAAAALNAALLAVLDYMDEIAQGRADCSRAKGLAFKALARATERLEVFSLRNAETTEAMEVLSGILQAVHAVFDCIE